MELMHACTCMFLSFQFQFSLYSVIVSDFFLTISYQVRYVVYKSVNYDNFHCHFILL